VLDVAPTRFSRSLFPRDVDYVSFDLASPLVMVRGDLTKAPLSSAGFDLWLCFHVLDAIPDDAVAMRELFRVLAPGGVGVLDHAMKWERPTEEYGPARRGQGAHVRRYGFDLPDRLRAVGFEVEVVDVGVIFSEEQQRRHGFRPRRFVVCRRPAAT
jgi:SAM-dependent methyltransferase